MVGAHHDGRNRTDSTPSLPRFAKATGNNTANMGQTKRMSAEEKRKVILK